MDQGTTQSWCGHHSFSAYKAGQSVKGPANESSRLSGRQAPRDCRYTGQIRISNTGTRTNRAFYSTEIQVCARILFSPEKALIQIYKQLAEWRDANWQIGHSSMSLAKITAMHHRGSSKKMELIDCITRQLSSEWKQAFSTLSRQTNSKEKGE